MARVFITGSSDGIGLGCGQALRQQGHQVVLHARNAARAADTRAAIGGEVPVVIGDLASMAQTRSVADQVNALGPMDAVIHNAGIGYREPKRIETEDGLAHVFAINVLAPYLLTALIARPARLVYVSSRVTKDADVELVDPQWANRAWHGQQAYSDTKLFDDMLAFGVARRWPDVLSNSASPGYVPTKLGGPDARDELSAGPVTPTWLAVSADPAVLVTGTYFRYQRAAQTHPSAYSVANQDRLIDYLAKITGVPLTAEQQDHRP
jgi:NAD(P)-dependent dehydrogenase (short-subunit alcohol dehydrogenase family)